MSSVAVFGLNIFAKLPLKSHTKSLKLTDIFRVTSFVKIQFRNNADTSKSRNKSANWEDTYSNHVSHLLNLVKTNPELVNNKNKYCTVCEKDDDSLAKDGRYNYPKEVEEAVNKQIVSEFNAGLSYLNMASYFGRTNIGLPGTQKFYINMYNEEVNHAMALIKYQEMRGGHVQLTTLNISNCGNDCTIRKSLELSLEMEKSVSDQLSQILALATKHHDIRTEDFISTDFMKEQIQSIRNLGHLLAVAIRMLKCGLSEFILDKELANATGHTITTKQPQ